MRACAILLIGMCASCAAACDPRVAADPAGLGSGEIGRYFANSPADGAELNDELRNLIVPHLRASHGRLSVQDQHALGLTCAMATVCTYTGSTVLRDDPRLPLPGPRRKATTRYEVHVRLLPPDDAHVIVNTTYHLADG